MPLPILFDMDGIILEGPRTSPQVYADAVDAALAELDATPSPAQRRELQRHDTTHLSEHCTALGIDPDRFWGSMSSAGATRPSTATAAESQIPTTSKMPSQHWASTTTREDSTSATSRKTSSPAPLPASRPRSFAASTIANSTVPPTRPTNSTH
ncbi:haloacid dehalogenase [Natrialba aegyptia DSM 13077]|uniref:Haloacid dehalogenase n=1 Tax=Natrialba aegyptia DSM 13077 TaxID=1227491 RepID=M0BA54_9EURY|nr:haloacid dehalogenase [Natrialba aegyptia DSM 13077]